MKRRYLAALAVPLTTLLLAFGCNSLVGLDELHKADCVGPNCARATDSGAVETAAETTVGDSGSADAPVVDSPAGTCSANPDPLTAAPGCGPKDFAEKPCTPFDAGPEAGCPSLGTRCAALTKNDVSSPIFNLRISHMQFWYPPVLRKVAGFLVHPQTNAKCTGGQEVLNLLLQFDTTQRKLKVGSARPSTDGVTFSFLTETFPSSAFGEACPGATRLPPAALEIKPYQVAYNISGPNISSDVMRGCSSHRSTPR